MSTRDILSSLRQVHFPDCVRSALDYLTTVTVNKSSLCSVPAAQVEAVNGQIVSEFIFFLHVKKKLNAIQELQVLEIILLFLTKQSSDTCRHTLFNLLFGTLTENECKMSLLSKLVSVSVGVQNTAVLNSTAVWMQTQGCNTPAVTQVMMVVLRDYSASSLGASADNLTQLVSVSSHFTCNLLTAITCTYTLSGVGDVKSGGRRPCLTRPLLELVCAWLMKEPQLCLVSLRHSHAAAAGADTAHRATLWTSPTKPNMQTPVPGLIKWCTKAPLVSGRSEQSAAGDSGSWASLWSQLHLSILQTLTAFSSLPGSQQLELITLADMNQTVKDLIALAHVSRHQTSLAVDRLVQILQVALATGAFRCSLGDLRGICQRLPPCRLLKIVESQHLSFAPPQMHNAS